METQRESILTSVKNSLGITEEQEEFDDVLLMHINSVMLSVSQIGVGPENGFEVLDKETSWSDLYFGRVNLNAVRSYIAMKVRMMFDPPQAGEHAKAINAAISELEWRLSIESEV